jgi:hypothetical protein
VLDLTARDHARSLSSRPPEPVPGHSLVSAR